jgi:hypothetical protein
MEPSGVSMGKPDRNKGGVNGNIYVMFSSEILAAKGGFFCGKRSEKWTYLSVSV